jgi:HKD family nuclease
MLAREQAMGDHISHVGVVENAGPNNLKSFFEIRAKKATRADIGVAFVTLRGFEQVSPLLKRIASRGQVNILTGLYQWFTEPRALRRLLEIQKLMGGKFNVRISTNEHFHWKAYFFFTGSRVSLGIGSSNLTLEGLKSSGEINLTLSLPNKSTQLRAIHEVFEAEWGRAKPLTASVVARYEKARRQQPILRSHSHVPLSRILGGPEGGVGESDLPMSYWRHAVAGWAQKATIAAVADQTDWDERGYMWQSTRRSSYKAGHRVVVFDLRSGFAELVEVRDATKVEGSTPDGKYFAAYVRAAGSHRRKLTRDVWAKLRRLGAVANRQDAVRCRKLTEAKFARLVDILRLA